MRGDPFADLSIPLTGGSLADCERVWMARHHQWLKTRRQSALERECELAPEPEPELVVAGRQGCEWSPEEVEIVRAGWGRISREALLKRLPGRTWERVCRQAGRLGITDRPTRNLLARQTACAILRCDWRTLEGAARQYGIRMVDVPTRPGSVYATPRAWARCYALHRRAWMALDSAAERRVFDAALARLTAARDRQRS